MSLMREAYERGAQRARDCMTTESGPPAPTTPEYDRKFAEVILGFEADGFTLEEAIEKGCRLMAAYAAFGHYTKEDGSDAENSSL